MKNGPAGPFSYDWIIYKRQRSRVRFFRFSARQSPQSISHPAHRLFSTDRVGHPIGDVVLEVVMLPTLVRFIFATSSFWISFAANAPKERVLITRDATIPVTSFIASTLHKVAYCRSRWRIEIINHRNNLSIAGMRFYHGAAKKITPAASSAPAAARRRPRDGKQTAHARPYRRGLTRFPATGHPATGRSCAAPVHPAGHTAAETASAA